MTIKRLDKTYCTFDTLAGLDAKRDLITVSLTENLTIRDQFAEWIKSFVSENTKIRPNNINLNRVAKNIYDFVRDNEEFFKIQAQNAGDNKNHSFNKFMTNIEILRDRFVAKHINKYGEKGVKEFEIYTNLTAALRVLGKMQSDAVLDHYDS